MPHVGLWGIFTTSLNLILRPTTEIFAKENACVSGSWIRAIVSARRDLCKCQGDVVAVEKLLYWRAESLQGEHRSFRAGRVIIEEEITNHLPPPSYHPP